MATRFYFSSTAVPTVTPGFEAWTRQSEGLRRTMSPTKDGSAMTNATFWANAAAAANDSCLSRQFVSDRMAAGITFLTGDTFKCQVLCMESAANDNINRAPIAIKVVSEDGNHVRATLKPLGHIGPNTTEWIASPTLTNKRVADGDALGAAYTTITGDRLAIEVGGQVSSGAGTSVTGTMRFGSAGSTDLGENETDTNQAFNPWFEISRDVTFAAAPDTTTALRGSYVAAPPKPPELRAAKSFIAASLLVTTLFVPPEALPDGKSYWPNPPARSILRIPNPPNLLTTTLAPAAAPTENPQYRSTWLRNIRPSIPSDNRTWVRNNLLTSTLSAPPPPEEPPPRQRDWPIPTSAIEATVYFLVPNLALVESAPPARKSDWPIPPKKLEPTHYFLVHNLSLAEVNPPNRPPDWRKPLAPRPLAQWIVPNLLSTTLKPVVVTDKPKAQYDWPLPPKAKKFRHPQFWRMSFGPVAPSTEELPKGKSNFTIPPKLPTKWHLLNVACLALGGTQSGEKPKAQYDWPIPQRPSQKWHLLNVSCLALGKAAFNQDDWRVPLARQVIQPILPPNLTIRLPVVAPALPPMRPREWPVPQRKKPDAIALPLNVTIRLPVVAPLPQIRQYAWPIPVAREVVQPVNLPTLLPIKVVPFRQREWPVPPRPDTPSTDRFLNITLRLPEPPPFKQLAWPNPPSAKTHRFDLFVASTIRLPAIPTARYDLPSSLPRPKFLTPITYSRPMEESPPPPAEEPPTKQFAWPLPPTVPEKPQRVSVLNLSLTALPFGQADWIVPARPAAIRAYIPPNLVLTVFEPVEFPAKQHDWPIPPAPIEPIDLRTITGAFSPDILEANPNLKPAKLDDWPIPVGPNQSARRFKYMEFMPLPIVATIPVVPPFTPVDQPNPDDKASRGRAKVSYASGSSLPLYFTITGHVTPFDLRVESKSSSSNTLYWSYTGTSTVGIYRAIHNGPFVAIDTIPYTIPVMLMYEDMIDVIGGTWYDYKLSDDGGVTYSNVASVVTQIYPLTTGSMQSSTAPYLPQFPTTADITPDTLSQLSQQVEATLNQTLINGPTSRCLACIDRGAVVFDCSNGCVAFEVDVTEDINSISILGCNECPDINFYIAADTTRSICGWPPFCDFLGDECFQAPIKGPRILNSNGLTSITDPKPMFADAECPCPVSSLDVRIICCEPDDDCTVRCAHPEVTLKACGGYTPYTWSHTGGDGVVLSKTTGDKIKVRKRFTGTAGLFPGVPAFGKLTIRNNTVDIPNGCGPPITLHQSVFFNINGPGYDCDGNSLGGNATSVIGVNSLSVHHADTICTTPPVSMMSNDTGQITYNIGGGAICSGGCATTFHLTWTPGAPIWSGASPTVLSWDVPLGSTDITLPEFFDLRTQAMVNAGCGCSEVTATVTVTDRIGHAATVIVAVG